MTERDRSRSPAQPISLDMEEGYDAVQEDHDVEEEDHDEGHVRQRVQRSAMTLPWSIRRWQHDEEIPEGPKTYQELHEWPKHMATMMKQQVGEAEFQERVEGHLPRLVLGFCEL